MVNFVFRCPATGLDVQGFSYASVAADRYIAQGCVACGTVHLVNPMTGKLVAERASPSGGYTG